MVKEKSMQMLLWRQKNITQLRFRPLPLINLYQQCHIVFSSAIQSVFVFLFFWTIQTCLAKWILEHLKLVQMSTMVIDTLMHFKIKLIWPVFVDAAIFHPKFGPHAILLLATSVPIQDSPLKILSQVYYSPRPFFFLYIFTMAILYPVLFSLGFSPHGTF